MTGILVTLLCSVFAAFYFITNDIFKIRGDVFVFWRSAFSTLALLPVIFFLDWNVPLPICLIVALANVFYTFGDIYLFNANKKYSASAITRILVCRNMVLFCVWPLLFHDYALRLFENKAILLGSFLLISTSTFALFKMGRNSIGREIIFAAIPALLFLSIGELFVGIAVKGRSTLDFALSLAFVASVTMATLSGAVLVIKSGWEKNIPLFEGSWVKSGIINAFFFLGVVTTKSIGISLLENPGYFGAMVTIYTLWIYLLHKYWLKRRELADPRLGFIVVLCSIGLAYLSVYIPK